LWKERVPPILYYFFVLRGDCLTMTLEFERRMRTSVSQDILGSKMHLYGQYNPDVELAFFERRLDASGAHIPNRRVSPEHHDADDLSKFQSAMSVLVKVSSAEVAEIDDRKAFL
jgi:hypothetical protein